MVHLELILSLTVPQALAVAVVGVCQLIMRETVLVQLADQVVVQVWTTLGLELMVVLGLLVRVLQEGLAIAVEVVATLEVAVEAVRLLLAKVWIVGIVLHPMRRVMVVLEYQVQLLARP